MGNIQRGYFNTSKLEYLEENAVAGEENIAKYGDFFFNTRNTLELVGKGATWTGESGKYAFNNNIARFELRNIDTIFFNYLYNTEEMTKQVHTRAMGTTSVAAIYPRSLCTIHYFLPALDEQKKIGAYFSNLDHLITLHQRKCDELQKLKKFMLQNMFTNIGNGKSHLFYYMDFIKKDKYPTGHRHEIRYKKRSFLRRMLQHIKSCCEKMSKINVSIQKKLL